MSEPSASNFCVNCGERLRADAKFCVNCGTPIPAVAEPAPDVGSRGPDVSEAAGGGVASAAGRTVAAAPLEPEILRPLETPPPVVSPPVVSPPVVSLPVAPPPLVAPKSPLLDRTQRTVLAVGIGVVIVVAAAIVLLTRNDDHSSVASANNTPATSVAALPSAVPNTESTAPTPTTIAALNSVVSRLDAELTDSAAQVAQLKNVIAGFAPSGNQACVPAATAAAQMGAIIDNRKAEVATLQTLVTTDDATARQLVILLQTAIGMSLQSDTEYQSWIAGNTGTDTTFPCRRASDANLQAAQNLEPRVGFAKTAFATAYDRVASRLGLRSDWASNNF